MKSKVNFKFSYNWIHFEKWYNSSVSIPTWDAQKKAIEFLFNKSAPNIINWDRLWRNHADWVVNTTISKNNTTILWNEQKRQIETLLLNQLSELNQNVWSVFYKDDIGNIFTYADGLSYESAKKAQRKLLGDGNGEGGKDNVSDAVVVNLNSLF
jgi:hypothetical protein